MGGIGSRDTKEGGGWEGKGREGRHLFVLQLHPDMISTI